MSFLSFGLAQIAINLVALAVNGTGNIMLTCLATIVVITVPTFFSIRETPQYLYKKGEITKMVDSVYKLARFNARNIRKQEIYGMVVNDP